MRTSPNRGFLSGCPMTTPSKRSLTGARRYYPKTNDNLAGPINNLEAAATRRRLELASRSLAALQSRLPPPTPAKVCGFESSDGVQQRDGYTFEFPPEEA